MDSFEELVAEGGAEPVEGWDFSWFQGRATEQRPSWGYAKLIGERMAAVESALDVQTGGGEVLASIPKPPARLVATEAWPPNAELARQRLAPLGATVELVGEADPFPFGDNEFDLVVSRHPVSTPWAEIARVLRPGGSFLSQQVGPGSMHEVSEAMLGPFEMSDSRDPQVVAAEAHAAGLDVIDLRHESLRAEFYDIGAVVYFLRKVIWMVPGFTVRRYRDQLRALHERIEAHGPFVAHSKRFLIEARKP